MDISDVTGAGDSVVATMGVLMSCGFSEYDAMVYSNQAAGIVVSRFGTSAIKYHELISIYDKK